MPLVVYTPESVGVDPSDPETRGWGVVGDRGGVVWVQDHALDTAGITEIRAHETIREGTTAAIADLAAGSWNVSPYDTWTGEWMGSYMVECPGGPCEVRMPDFHSDIALHLSR